MSNYTTSDAVKFATDGDVAKFKDAIDDAMLEKIKDAVSIKRTEVASSFLQQETENSD